jgi:hypothetical protein
VELAYRVRVMYVPPYSIAGERWNRSAISREA